MKVHTAGGRKKKEEKLMKFHFFFPVLSFFSSFSVHTRHSGVS